MAVSAYQEIPNSGTIMYALCNVMTPPSVQASGLIRQVAQVSGLTRQVSQVSGLTRQVSQVSGLIIQVSPSVCPLRGHWGQ